MKRKKKLIALIIIIIIAGVFYFSFVAAPDNDKYQTLPSQNSLSGPSFNPKTCQYLIDGMLATDAQYFGNDASGDFNSDGLNDTASIIFLNSEGSGTFYYLVVAFRQADGSCRGSNAILLGDRIAPQAIEYSNGEIIANYADRRPGEAMTAQPSAGESKHFKVENNTLVGFDLLSSAMPENYDNSQYGFSLSLPPSWEKYSIINDAWSGQLLIAPNTKYQGPKIVVRNRNWTEEKHWQDIPILIFSHEEWKLIAEENLSVSAAPIGPSKLGENTNYVFALPPRWLGFTDDLGQDQAAEIVKTFKAY